jgi:hypothetical protein
MTERLRINVVLIVLLAQVCGSFNVFCTASAERLVPSFVSQSCCGDGVPAGTDPATDPDSCRCCQDAPLAVVLHHENDNAKRELPLPCRVSTPPSDRCGLPPHVAVLTDSLRVALRRPVPLVGTVVLVC